MNLIKLISPVASVLIFSAALNAHAALYDRGNGLIYDSTQNITWLLDMNLAQTSGYLVDGGGQMSWNEAKTWANNLVYEGYSDWRLPSAKPTGNSNFSYDGSTDYGYNNTRAELGHLYYVDLGNLGNWDIFGQGNPPHNIQASFYDSATGLTKQFLNFQNYAYWENEPANAPLTAWYANQFTTWAGLGSNTDSASQNNLNFAVAVREGDSLGDGTGLTSAVGVIPSRLNPVPVPAAGWLFGSAIFGLTGYARRKFKPA